MTATALPRTAEARDTRARWRGDVEGLRAVAVGLVLAYHAGIGPPAGFVGVDVFFVVSGFVITTQVVREVERDGRLSLPRFYARRAKRLLPAAGLVLLTTALLTWLLAPRTQRGTFGLDVAGSAAYVVNWVFAGRSVDYLAEDLEPSPVLHFWSLAVEEQFYLVWPLAILVVLALHRRVGRRGVRTSLAAGLSVLIIVPTFLASLVLTATDPAVSFFVTVTRLWEMGLGAFVALGARRWERLTPRAAAALGWAGVVGIAASAVLFSVRTPWPGSAALLPTVSVAAVVVAGFRAHRSGPEAVLGTAPMRWVGGLSYSLYLWHWPVLRASEWLFGEAGPAQGTAAVLASVLPAWLSYRFVENPLRYGAWLSGPPRRALAMGAAVSAVCLLAGLAMVAVGNAASRTGGDRTGATWASTSEPPGPERAGDAPFFDTLTPTPEGAPEDVPALYAEDCQVRVDQAELRPCTGGDPEGAVDVVVVGDSKIAQWVPAVEAAARSHGWRVTVHTKSACPLVDATVALDGAPNESCRWWGQAVLAELTGPHAPDVVVTSTVKDQALLPDGSLSAPAFEEALTRTWERIQGAGAHVVAVSDTPVPPEEIRPVYECLARHADDTSTCSWPYEQSPASRMSERVAALTGASFVDMDPWVCPGGTCVGEYRNVLTYRQGSHVTATFVGLLTEPFTRALAEAVDRSSG